MYNILIDPLSLVLSSRDLNSDKFQLYLDNLIETVDLRCYDFLNPLILEKVYSLINDEDDYLNVYDLNKWFEEFDVKGEYTSNDIKAAYNIILKFDAIDNLFQLENYILKELKVLSDGKEILVEEIFKTDSLFLYSLISKLENGETYLKGIADLNLNYTGEVTKIEVNEGLLNVPYKIDGNLRMFSANGDILKKINVFELWKESSKAEEFSKLIKIYFNNNATQKEKRTWTIGKDFFKNFKKHGFYIEDIKIEKLLKAMYVVVYEESRKSHALRSSASGGARPKVSRLGTAMRMDIDYEYHLHYWIKQNHIIFAKVSTHNDFHIPK